MACGNFFFSGRAAVSLRCSVHTPNIAGQCSKRAVGPPQRGQSTARASFTSRYNILSHVAPSPIKRAQIKLETSRRRSEANASRPAAPTSRVRSPHVHPPTAHTDQRLRRREPPDLIRRRSFRAKLARRRLFELVLHDENQPHPAHVRRGGDTRVTASPRTKRNLTARLVVCGKGRG